jgi:hypothetical protein
LELSPGGAAAKTKAAEHRTGRLEKLNLSSA